MIRLVEQFKTSGTGLFLTLTYDDDHVPIVVNQESGDCYYTLCKRHIQLWMKRLKIRLVRAGVDMSKFAYFVAGEYGMHPGYGSLFRPHYHLILFGLRSVDVLPDFTWWCENMGRISEMEKVRTAAGCSRYVSKYVAKGRFMNNPWVKKQIVIPEFHLCSHGLGADYIKVARERLGLPTRSRLMQLVDPQIPYMPCGKNKFECLVNQSNGVIYYSKRYLEFVVDNLDYRNPAFVDNRSGKIIRFKLPKYYRDRVLGHTVYLVGARPFKYKKVLQKSALQAQVADFLFKRSIERYDEKCRAFKNAVSTFSDSEIFAEVEKAEIASLVERDKVARESLDRFYKKSKF